MNINGPGKYDDDCTKVRIGTKAEGVLLAIFNGTRGNGFSVQAPAEILMRLPTILRQMADDIEGKRL